MTDKAAENLRPRTDEGRREADGADLAEWALRHADDLIEGIVDPWELGFAKRMRERLAATLAAPAGLRTDVAALRETAKEQMTAGGALASAAFFEGQVYAYDEVLRRLEAAPRPPEPGYGGITNYPTPGDDELPAYPEPASVPAEGLAVFLHAHICDPKAAHDPTLGRCWALAREYALAAGQGLDAA